MTLSSHLRPLDDGTTTIGTITFAGACTVDDTITITDAAGTTRVFTAKGSTTAGSLQFINTDATAAATALKLCIDNAAGFGTNSITVADSGAGVLTLTLLVDATYRFKKKSSIRLMTGINANVTSVDFAGGAAAEDIDGHTIAGGGTAGGFNSKANIKNVIDLVKGIKSSGSKLIVKTGTATKPGVSVASNLSGNIFAYNPNGRSITRSATDTGFLIRGGTATKIAGAASTGHLISIPGSDTGQRNSGNIHEKSTYRQHGLWSDTILDLFNGKVYAADGAAKTTILNRGDSVALATDGAVTSKETAGEFVILSNFVDYTTDSTSGGTAAGTNLKNYSDITG
jgi:hypothetical protein|tara:strand:+ start:5561 stop:6583 length:1023 start_codon:yes stop_codon:yes gene_type:complete